MDFQVDVAGVKLHRVSQRQDETSDVLRQLLARPPLRRFRFAFDILIGHHHADAICRERGIIILLFDPATMTPRLERDRDKAFLREGYAVFRLPINNLKQNPKSVTTSLQAILEGRIEEFVEGM